jgi:RNAse (barnase) inhibitor barstar
MDDWGTVFSSYLNSGVYRLEQGRKQTDIKKAAALYELDFTHIDLKKVGGKETFLKKTARALRFPEYFGMNWDALSDCLTDMSWKPAPGYVLLFTRFRLYTEKATADGKVISQIFDSSTKYWRQKEVPFYVILLE